MTIELSHGKARPTLPRASDLPTRVAPRAVDEPGRHRDAAGRFVAGNGVALGRGARAEIRRLLGRGGQEATDAEAKQVARDCERLFSAALRELPSDGTTVRQLVAMWARETALCAFWSVRASEAGLSSEDGIAAADRSTRHGTRAERLAISMLDVASRLAPKAGGKPGAGALARIRAASMKGDCT